MKNERMDRWKDADLPVHIRRLGLVDLPSANWVARARRDGCTDGSTDRHVDVLIDTQIQKWTDGRMDVMDIMDIYI